MEWINSTYAVPVLLGILIGAIVTLAYTAVLLIIDSEKPKTNETNTKTK